MSVAIWLRIVAIAVGTLALALLVWFGGPFIAIGEVRPFEPLFVRLPLVLLFVIGAAVWIALIVIRRRKAVAALSEALAKEESSTGDGAALSSAMRDALATLKRTRGKEGGDYLYDLPWYVMIGPPGAGKTTALVNSGLKFPLARGGQTPAAVAGNGGTRYCDWWFAEEAVLIDTAGRYTTQDTDTKAERASWLSFLDLLKNNRPRQPINGVMVAISVEDLLTSTPEQIVAHAEAIRSRLLELNERLKIDFPVYAVFTKADLIAGFNEFFGGLSEPQRRMVWGHTFQTLDKTRNMVGDVPPEFDALIERLNERLADRLQDEHNPTARAQLFGLPSQMAALKPIVIDFLGRVFEPTRYQQSATLRGFYFTSGTQEGTPIDQLIGALSRNFGSEHAGAGTFSGRGKSYFLTDLIQKVIIGESGWVSTDLRATRRSSLLRAAGFSAIALAALTLAGLWWTSYSRNSDLINQTNYALADYRSSAAPVLQETTISERNFSRVLPLLHKLRHMPAGYAGKDEPTPVSATFGLSQRERLQSATQISYQEALERMLRSRIIFRLEEQLEANANNPGFIYEALKVYLMVGGQAKLDRDLVLAWMRLDWAENLFPGAANAKGREALEEHLTALLDLDEGAEPLVKLNQTLIESSQRTLRRMSIAERAYELLRTQGRNGNRDWVAAQRGGSDVRLVFEGVSGEDLDTIRVPYFYTYDGFQNAFVDRLGDIGERIEKERWVLGENVDQAAITSQYASLFQDLLRLYSRDFTASWQRALRRLKLRPLNADKPKYVALSAIAAPTSPFKQLLESVRDETQLTKERAARRPTAAEAAAQAGKEIAAKTLEQRANAALGRLGTTLPLSAPGVDRVLSGSSEALGANIEGGFKQFHVLVDGDLGRRPVDQALQIFAEINQNLAMAATTPAQSAAANAALVPLIASLRGNSSRYPAPFDAMIVSAVNDFEGDATGATISLLRQALGNEVARTCTNLLTNRYPFTKGSTRDIALSDFAQLFAPGTGAMDKFMKERLDPYIDKSGAQWVWRSDSRVARSLSPTTLREFQRASDIREAFFPTGGNLPSFQMVVVPTALSADASGAKLEINGFTVASQQGVNTPTPVMWPGAGLAKTSITLTLGGAAGGGSAGGIFGGGFFSNSPTPAAPSEVKLFERDGIWSFFRLLDAGSVLRQGDNVVFTLGAGGRQVGYQFGVGSLKNPLVLPALREIRCPTGI